MDDFEKCVSAWFDFLAYVLMLAIVTLLVCIVIAVLYITNGWVILLPLGIIVGSLLFFLGPPFICHLFKKLKRKYF